MWGGRFFSLDSGRAVPLLNEYSFIFFCGDGFPVVSTLRTGRKYLAANNGAAEKRDNLK